jgi:hypothetical protein
MVLKKRLNFFSFQWEKVDQVRSEYLRSYLNWLHNWQLKSTRRSHTLKGSQSMGDGRILIKPRRDDSFKKVLSNEPNFGRIHLAGQCLIWVFFRNSRMQIRKKWLKGSMTPKFFNFFFNIWVSKKRRILRWFQIWGNNLKKVYLEKVICQKPVQVSSIEEDKLQFCTLLLPVTF